ncbi:hypothetical protein [Streptomyces sp. NPDC001380]|uniref:hypothetical protein n=1 Tax=Streptomyces sp. NPDC001380 TaxID=3364566 RepID=UPI0036ACDB85
MARRPIPALAAVAAALALVMPTPAQAAGTDSGGGCFENTLHHFRVCISSADHLVRPDYYLDRVPAFWPGEHCRVHAYLERTWKIHPHDAIDAWERWEWYRPFRTGHVVFRLPNPQSYGPGDWTFGIAGECAGSKKHGHGWLTNFAPVQTIRG